MRVVARSRLSVRLCEEEADGLPLRGRVDGPDEPGPLLARDRRLVLGLHLLSLDSRVDFEAHAEGDLTLDRPRRNDLGRVVLLSEGVLRSPGEPRDDREPDGEGLG